MPKRNGHDDAEVRISQPVETTRAQRAAMAAERVRQETPQPSPQASESGFPILGEAAATVLSEALAIIESEAATRLKTAIEALREESEISIACMRDELLSKVDQKLYGRGLIDFDAAEVERAVREMRRKLDEKLAEFGKRLDTLSAQLTTFERETLKTALTTRRSFVAQVTRQRGTISALETQLATMTTRVDRLTQAVHEIYEGLGEQPPSALSPLALPAPA
jgi:uncharacterized coiled-coil protein SlyX